MPIMWVYTIIKREDNIPHQTTPRRSYLESAGQEIQMVQNNYKPGPKYS